MSEERPSVSRRKVLGGLGVLGTGAVLSAGSLAQSDETRTSMAEAALSLVPPGQVTHEAVADGAWSDPSIWDDGEVPGDDAHVRIGPDATVTLDGEREERLRTVRVDGTLRADPAVETALAVETMVVVSSGRLELGTGGTPATTTITFLDRGPLAGPSDDPPVARGLLVMGAIRAHGVERTSFLPTAAPPMEDDTTIELASAPTGWSAGDEIVVAGIAPDRNEDEERTIASVDGSTVHVEEPFAYDHAPPADDLSVHVANLERSVRLVSESTETRRRGHVVFLTSDVELSNLGAYELGRTDKSRSPTNPANGNPPRDVEPNPLARYALHFHRTGTDEDDGTSRLDGCLVRGSPGWGIVNHGSRVVAENCVTYDVFGAGFVAERGDEQGAFRNNLALRSEGSGYRVDARQFHEPDRLHGSGHPERADVDDFGHGGHGFWLQGPGMAIEGNVAAGHRHFAYVYWNRGLPDEPVPAEQIGGVRGKIPNYPVEHLENQPTLAHSDRVEDGKVPSSYVSIRSFADNTAYASAAGMEISRHQFGYDHDRREEYSVVEGFTVHSVGPFLNKWDSIREEKGRMALKLRYSSNVRLEGCRFLGTDDRGVGIRRNHALTGLPMTDCEIRDWELGVHAPEDGPVPIRDCTFDNATDLTVVGGHSRRWNPPQTVRIEGTEFLGGAGTPIEYSYDLEGNRYGILSRHSWLALDDRTVYAASQAPDYVPFPDEEALAASEHSDDVSDLATVDSLDHQALVGKDNAELQSAFGLSVGGVTTPASATSDERVPGCSVATDAPVERFVDVGTASPDAGFESVDGSGQGALRAVADSEEYPPSSGLATVEFSVPAGRYAPWMRAIAPDDDSDSLWFHVDDGDWIRWNRIDEGRSWSWHRAHDTDDGHEPVWLDLDGGTHELTVGYRESDLALDAIYLTDSHRRPFGPPSEF